EEDQEEEAIQDNVKQEHEEEANQEPQPEQMQPARNRKTPERLTYAQTKHVEFDVTVDAEIVEEYNPQLAMVIARCMTEINSKAMTLGAGFAQQYILQKGLMKFKRAGEQAASKNLSSCIKETVSL
ncbi:MAG: hypothetical protein ACP5M1_13270, partial [Acidiphilium sp.]